MIFEYKYNEEVNFTLVDTVVLIGLEDVLVNEKAIREFFER